ncbi:ATP-binding protein [Mesorhizobium sp. M2D.F.Ca.ET.225.01.1.1]|uniref:DNA-packaging protein n=1 Tax=unclassified Mesorhizobium TaxID=325217 RepID=UPI000FD29118|nr:MULTISPECIES: terminase family protein [unclassified Mesorhizobium]TGP55771.1 ATP-binding protein [Mesorhizobium sp. M2D.F.Ca.ET.226.01.1.1]TGP68229.1 ATP-binding protein [Mesorhizobium sp. M2D.F.Ca.ET.225.01.1.1]
MPKQSNGLAAALAESLATSWRMKARPEQIAPEGDWAVWLVLAGRGFGKTRTGAEWVHEQIAAGKSRIALVGPTAGDARDIMVEGESGILASAPKWNRPDYQPALRKLTWPNGAIAMTFSADEPERLRGPQHEAAWCDELGAWRYSEAWDQLQFGLRIGTRPQAVVTTTPKPTKILRDLIARAGQDVVITRGKTKDNASNLAPSFIKAIEDRYGGTRLGRQELDGELLEDIAGALWQRSWFDRDRVEKAPELKRIVVAIDPAISNKEGSDETGIVVAGLGFDGRGYVLDDDSGRYAPNEWADRAVQAFRAFKADRIVAEKNQGGDLVEATIRMVDPHVPYRAVHASRGKAVRAEPVSALYEQGKISHVGAFPTLEDQLASFASDFDRARAGFSPDRLDALVWAFSELMVKEERKIPVGYSVGTYTMVGGDTTFSRSGSGGNPYDQVDAMLAAERVQKAERERNYQAYLDRRRK